MLKMIYFEGRFSMKEEKSRSNFSGTLGFVLAAAGSAVGLGKDRKSVV